MRRLMIMLAAVAAMLAVSASAAGAATWPAHCHNMRCVNKHLNALHKAAKAQGATVRSLRSEVTALEDTSIPSGNALQAEIDQLGSTETSDVNNIEAQINQLWAQPALSGCWSQLAVSRFDGSGTVYTQGWPYNDYVNSGPSGYPEASRLDLAHADQPRNGFIYRLVFNACTSG